MKRLIVSGPRVAEFEEVPVPECPPEGLLVKARVTAVSTGTEIRVYRAQPVDAEGKFLHEHVPFVLPTENGYSMVGEVLEVGSEVEGFSVGERVFSPSPHKQIAAVSASQVVKVPAEIPDGQAVFLNILEVAHIALRRGNPHPGENIAIVGQGVIGLAGLCYCRAFGFRTAAVDLNERRLAIASELGADLAISPATDGFADRVLKFFDGDGADVVLEAASNWSAVRSGMQIARSGGRVVVVSRHIKSPEFNPVGHPFLGKKLELLTSYGYPTDGQRWDRRRSIALTLQMLSQKQLKIEPMITHRFDWEELPNVYRRLDEGAGEIVGAIIRW